MRSSWLLFALMALVAMTAAVNVEDALHIDGINAYMHHGVKRQAQGTGASPSPQSTADASSSPDAPATSAATPATLAATPSSDDTAPSSTAQPTSPNAAASTTNTPAAPKSSASLSTKELVSTEVAASTVLVTVIDNGSTAVQTSVGSRTIEHTTGSVVETSLANSQSNNNGGGGLSSTNKSIIGGVVGGVGGAILLGGIALVCWRMWGKKKRVSEDDADLMAGTGSALGDKSHSSASPFQSNLEQYHNPGGRPNAAANF